MSDTQKQSLSDTRGLIDIRREIVAACIDPSQI